MKAKISIKNFEKLSSGDLVPAYLDGELISCKVQRALKTQTVVTSSADGFLREAIKDNPEFIIVSEENRIAAKDKMVPFGEIKLKPIYVKVDGDETEFAYEPFEDAVPLIPQTVSRTRAANDDGYPIVSITYEKAELAMKGSGKRHISWRTILYFQLLLLLAYRTRNPFTIMMGETWKGIDPVTKSPWCRVGLSLGPTSYSACLSRNDDTRQISFLQIENLFGGGWCFFDWRHDESETVLWKLFLRLGGAEDHWYRDDNVGVYGYCFDDGYGQAYGGLFDCSYSHSRYYVSYTGFRPSSDPS